MLWLADVECQIDTSRIPARKNTQDSRGAIQLTRDTAILDDITWQVALHPKQTGTVNAYLEDTLIFFYNPAKQSSQEHATLGNLGSPYYKLFYELGDEIGLRINGSPYSIYDFDVDKFKFYKIEAGYTDVSYSQSGQTNSMFDGLFTRNFNSDKTNFVLKYRRINQAGIYSNQQLKHTYLSAGINSYSFDDRLQTSIIFASNLANHNTNGGITDNATLNGNFGQRQNVLVNINSSSSNRDHRLQYVMKNTWNFFKKRNSTGKKSDRKGRNSESRRGRDSTLPDEGPSPKMDSLLLEPIVDTLLMDTITFIPDLDTSDITGSMDDRRDSAAISPSGFFSNRDLLLFHTIRYDNFAYTHKNENPSLDYHSPYFLISDSLDFNLEGYSLSNEAGLQLSLGQKNPLDLSSSIEYISHSIKAAKYNDHVTDLILHNNLSFKIKNKYLFDGQLDVGLGNNSGELLAKGIISAKPNDLIRGQTSLTLLTRRPQYTQSNIILNDSLQQSNVLNNQKSVIWSTRVDIPKYHLSFGYNSVVLQDFIYWDVNRKIQQADNTLSLQQFVISSKIKWKFLHLVTQAKFQLVSDKDKLRLPPLLLQETLYVSGSIFKKQMKYQAGIHLNLIGKYEFMTYYPVLGIFHQADHQETRHTWIYPDATLFFEFKVNKFKMFILAENLSAYFKTDVEFELANYPQFDNRIRLGIRWVFRK